MKREAGRGALEPSERPVTYSLRRAPPISILRQTPSQLALVPRISTGRRRSAGKKTGSTSGGTVSTAANFPSRKRSSSPCMRPEGSAMAAGTPLLRFIGISRTRSGSPQAWLPGAM